MLPFKMFQQWWSAQGELLELEQKEEVERHVAIVLTNFRLAGLRVGSFGKTTLTLSRENALSASAMDLSPGSPVKISCPRWKEPDLLGIFTRFVSDKEVQVNCTIDNWTRDDAVSFHHDITLTSLPDKTTMKRISKALVFAPQSKFSHVLFAPSLPTTVVPSSATLALDSVLNEGQCKAIQYCLSAADLAIVHGPPGTGKTHTLTKLIASFPAEERILCVAPSNVAVDNLLMQLLRNKDIAKLELLRIGHASRVNSALHGYTLDCILETSDEVELIADAKQELLACVNKERRGEIRKEIKRRERKMVSELISGRCRIVLTTLSSSAKLLKLKPEGFFFSKLIVDEAAQATEASVWIPLQLLDPKRGVLILAGDHKQLPPTVLSDQAVQGGLSLSMMERIVLAHPNFAVLLNTQYRMNEQIMKWPNQAMYNNQLQAHDSVSHRTLRDLFPSFSQQHDEDEELFGPLMFLDTAGCGFFETETDSVENTSRSNIGEAVCVIQHVHRLLSLGLSCEQIAVISPYAAQVSLIRQRLSASNDTEGIEVKSVDGFQGQEREAIIISMVRSNGIGFLSDERRMNVAITRAKRHVCLVGDSSVLEKNLALNSLLLHFQDCTRSAMEFLTLENTESIPYKPTSRKKMPVANRPTLPPQPLTLPSSSSSVSIAKLKPPAKVIAPPKVHSSTPTSSLFAEFQHVDDHEDDEMVLNPNPPAITPSGKSVSLSSKKPVQEKKGEAKNEDEFLDQVIAASKLCAFPGCKTVTVLIGHDCVFCKSRFCMKHRQSEVHGCGRDARKFAKEANYSKKPPLKAQDRTRLQEKLREKLKVEETERNQKKPIPKKKL